MEEFEKISQIIRENDRWIAAVAIEGKIPLAPRDACLDRVDGLAVVQW